MTKKQEGRQWGILRKGWTIIKISSVILKNRESTAAEKKRAKSYRKTGQAMVLSASKKLGLSTTRATKMFAKMK